MAGGGLFASPHHQFSYSSESCHCHLLFTEGADAEAEAATLWPRDVKS